MELSQPGKKKKKHQHVKTATKQVKETQPAG